MIILPRRRALFTEVSSWADWDELTEAGLASDDIFVCMMENPVDDSNELGQGGGFTGADLVGLNVGTVVGATGSPPSRAFAPSDAMTWTKEAFNAIVVGDSFTFVQKWTDYSDITSTYPAVFSLSTEQLWLNVNASSKLELSYTDQTTTGVPYAVVTTDSVPTTGPVYFAIWSDGSSVSFGFCTSKPTKLSDFDVGKRVVWAISADWDGAASGECCMASYSASGQPTGNLFYFVASKTCLIDNAS